MSIHLSMTVDDPYTEDLLLYLQKQFGSNYAHKLWVLKLAQEWLRLQSPGSFIVAEGSTRKPTLEILSPASEFPSQSHTPVPLQEHQMTSQEVHK